MTRKKQVNLRLSQQAIDHAEKNGGKNYVIQLLEQALKTEPSFPQRPALLP